MSDTKTAQGICTEISEKSGWTSFHIDVGTQYPVRLATKKQEIIDAGRAVGQTPSTWTYNEVESDKINEHTGRPFVNRYLEKVEAGVLPATNVAAPSTPSAEPARPPLQAGDKDRAITRMACLKAAAETVNRSGVDGPDADYALEVMKIAQRYEQWVMRDIDPIPF